MDGNFVASAKEEANGLSELPLCSFELGCALERCVHPVSMANDHASAAPLFGGGFRLREVSEIVLHPCKCSALSLVVNQEIVCAIRPSAVP